MLRADLASSATVSPLQNPVNARPLMHAMRWVSVAFAEERIYFQSELKSCSIVECVEEGAGPTAVHEPDEPTNSGYLGPLRYL